MRHNYYVYMMSNKKHGSLYIGVTNNLAKRVSEHQHGIIKGFSSQYNLDKLVYCEHGNSIEGAIMREKQLKNWHRDWKIALIEKENPTWEDLSLKL